MQQSQDQHKASPPQYQVSAGSSPGNSPTGAGGGGGTPLQLVQVLPTGVTTPGNSTTNYPFEALSGGTATPPAGYHGGATRSSGMSSDGWKSNGSEGAGASTGSLQGFPSILPTLPQQHEQQQYQKPPDHLANTMPPGGPPGAVHIQHQQYQQQQQGVMPGFTPVTSQSAGAPIMLSGGGGGQAPHHIVHHQQHHYPHHHHHHHHHHQPHHHHHHHHHMIAAAAPPPPPPGGAGFAGTPITVLGGQHHHHHHQQQQQQQQQQQFIRVVQPNGQIALVPVAPGGGGLPVMGHAPVVHHHHHHHHQMHHHHHAFGVFPPGLGHQHHHHHHHHHHAGGGAPGHRPSPPPPRPGGVDVIDPALCIGKITLPRSKVFPSLGLQYWDAGTCRRDLSVCCLFQQGRCHAGEHCHQVHAERDYIAELRRTNSAPECCPHCTARGDVADAVKWLDNVVGVQIEYNGKLFNIPKDRMLYTQGAADHIKHHVRVHRSQYRSEMHYQMLQKRQQQQQQSGGEEGAAGTSVTSIPGAETSTTSLPGAGESVTSTGSESIPPAGVFNITSMCKLFLHQKCRYAKDCKWFHVCPRFLGVDEEEDVPPHLRGVARPQAYSQPQPQNQLQQQQQDQQQQPHLPAAPAPAAAAETTVVDNSPRDALGVEQQQEQQQPLQEQEHPWTAFNGVTTTAQAVPVSDGNAAAAAGASDVKW